MKKIFFAIFAMTGLLMSCSNDDITITTTPKIRTLSYVTNTQSMYDDLGITSEVSAKYLSNGYSIGVYTFIYDSSGNKVSSKSSTSSTLGSNTDEFSLEEGSYTVVTYETLVGNGNKPSCSGDDKLSTLVFEDNSSSDYHFILGRAQNTVSLNGGNQTTNATPEATRHLLTLNIGTQSMYDTFNRSSFEQKLSSEYNYYVGITSLVYDNSGQFVDSACTYVKTFQSLQQKFCLRDGNYTVITIETLVNGDNNYISDYWELDNIQSLSSVILMKSNSTEGSWVYWDGVVGTSNCNASIGNSNQTQTTTPVAKGSLVTAIADNFDKSDYTFVEFCTKNAPDGIMLSPNVSEKYYYINYEKSDYWKIRGFMGNLSTYVFPERESMTVYIIESGAINWGLGCTNESYITDDGLGFDKYPEGDNYYTFQDGQTYFAYIRYRGDAQGCDVNLGTYDEISTWVANLEPIGVLFVEPYTKWGATVASVKSAMSSYLIRNENLEENGRYVLTYNGKYKEDQIRYWFTSQTGGLIAAVVFFDSEKIGEDELSKAFYDMGYTFLGSGDNYSLYKTKDGMSFVEVGLNNNKKWYVLYSSASSTSAPRRTMKKDVQSFAPKRQNSAISSNIIGKASIVNSLRHCENMMKFFK